jgi:hypothetical protein
MTDIKSPLTDKEKFDILIMYLERLLTLNELVNSNDRHTKELLSEVTHYKNVYKG